MKKRVLSLMLVMCVLSTLIAALPITVSAATSGTCGPNLTWTLDNDGTLTISGTGTMNRFDFFSSPWYLERASIEKIIISNGVTSIGGKAFYYCTSLTSITIPDSVTSIGEHAFYYCDSLTSISIPNSVTSIGENAFSHCDSLTSISIPNSVTSIRMRAFYYCDSLTSITIPNSVTSIGVDAFCGCSSLTSITIPDSVTSIGEQAFSYCSSLTSITIPDSVTSIGEHAFSYCYSLKSITVDANNPKYSSLNEVLFNKNKTTLIQYAAGKNDTTYAMPNSVTSIGDYAFYNCESLTSITIPNSVTSIGEGAFCGCSSIKVVLIGSGVESIEKDAFKNCIALEEIVVDNKNGTYSSDERGVLFDNTEDVLVKYPTGNTAKTYTIPDGVTKILDNAFEWCSNLTCVNMSNSVTSIGEYAFSLNSNLTKIDLSSNILEIGEHAFFLCSKLKSITIPKNVTGILDCTFSDCSELSRVDIPSSVTNIGDFAFSGCPYLTDVFYGGSKTDWGKISIDSNNEDLLEATIHYYGYSNEDESSVLRFYYSKEEIEPGDIVYIGADDYYGSVDGMYYPGKVEWKVSNEDVIKLNHTVENVTVVTIEALALGKSELSLYLDGELKCTEVIDVALTNETMLNEYRDYLMKSASMTLLSDARDTCMDIINRYSSGDKTRVAFFTCLKEDLGLSIITKEALAAIGMTSSTHQDTVDEAIDLLIAELCSIEKQPTNEQFAAFKKKLEIFSAHVNLADFASDTYKEYLTQITSFSKQQIEDVSKVAKKFIGSSTSMAELVSASVLTVQYERDVVTSLMNVISGYPGGAGTDLYIGLERQLNEMDDLSGYVANRYLNEIMVKELQALIETGLFDKEKGLNIFDKTVWEVASKIGKLISLAYENEGGVFADNYLKACTTLCFAATLNNSVENNSNAMMLEDMFKTYIASVKVALNSAIELCNDPYIYSDDLKAAALGYLNQIESGITYDNLLSQFRNEVEDSGDYTSNVYLENDKIMVDAYRKLPEKSFLMYKAEENFSGTGYDFGQLICVPSHIDGNMVNGIGAHGFEGISDKYGVILPDSIIRIGGYAFADCSNTTFAVLGDSVEEIGEYAFNNNSNLKMVHLPQSLEIIKEGAFNNCSNLATIVTEAKEIEANAFSNCTSLESITFKNKEVVIAEDAFENCNDELTVYAYKNTNAQEFALINGYTFVEVEEFVSSLEIVSSPTKKEYVVGETIDTEGLSLLVTYTDNTSEVVTDGWIAYGDTSEAGNVAVKVYYGEQSVIYIVNVVEPEELSIELDFTNLTMMTGSGKQLSARVLPNGLKNVDLEWTTSDSSVATVDSRGFVEAIGVGDATITVKKANSELIEDCVIEVVDSKKVTLNYGEPIGIVFTPRENGVYSFYSKSNSNSEIEGTISDINGDVLYKNKANNFRIEGKLHKNKMYILGISSDYNVNDLEVRIQKCVEAESIYICDSAGTRLAEITGLMYDEYKLNHTFAPENYIDQTVEWESSDTSVATVDKHTGLVTFKLPGRATISVTSAGGLMASCNVMVESERPSATYNDDETEVLSAFFEYGNNSKCLNWNNANPIYWQGIEWVFVDGEYHVWFVNLANIDVNGKLDLSGFNFLEVIAFAESGIEEVILPSSCDWIGDMSFYNCDNLKRVLLSKNTTGIGEEAFAGCDSLYEIHLPRNIEYIGYNAFGETNNTKIIYDGNLYDWEVVYRENSDDYYSNLTINEKDNSTVRGRCISCYYDDGYVFAKVEMLYVKEDCKGMMAIYDEDNLVAMEDVDVKVDDWLVEFCCPVETFKSSYTAKFFFWKNDGSLKPLTEALEVS